MSIICCDPSLVTVGSGHLLGADRRSRVGTEPPSVVPISPGDGRLATPAAESQ